MLLPGNALTRTTAYWGELSSNMMKDVLARTAVLKAFDQEAAHVGVARQT